MHNQQNEEIMGYSPIFNILENPPYIMENLVYVESGRACVILAMMFKINCPRRYADFTRLCLEISFFFQYSNWRKKTSNKNKMIGDDPRYNVGAIPSHFATAMLLDAPRLKCFCIFCSNIIFQELPTF